MALFNYKNLSSNETKALVSESFDLATKCNLPVLPAGWSNITPSQLGLPNTILDVLGNYKIESPLTGSTPSGPQARILGKYDSNGKLTELSIVFLGTNSPVDVADYLQLNSGKIASKLSPILDAVAQLARSNNLSAKDVIVTGYSLGGGMTNIMSRFSDTLAGGFFNDANYVGYAAPVIDDNPNRIMNIGAENDIVYRLTGDHTSFWDAVNPTLPLLTGQDYTLKTTNDNIVLFTDKYASPLWPFGAFSLFNLNSWNAHMSLATSGVLGGPDPLDRVMNSRFYELMGQDSVVVIANLDPLTRATTWVEDRYIPSAANSHYGDQVFLVGTSERDLLRDGSNSDFIAAGDGDDLIRVTRGYDVVEGAGGSDTVRVTGDSSDWNAYRVSDGTLYLFSKSGNGLKQLSNVEYIEFERNNILGVSIDTHYSVQSDRLEDEHFSLFQLGDRDLAYQSRVEGGAGNDTLTGSVVFGMGGNDIIRGGGGADLLVGGAGDDWIDGASGADAIYGCAGNDRLIAGAGDRLNGGVGSDEFVFVAGVRGAIVIEDFNGPALGRDVLTFDRSILADARTAMSCMSQSGDNVILRRGDLALTLEHTQLSDITAQDFRFA